MISQSVEDEDGWFKMAVQEEKSTAVRSTEYGGTVYRGVGGTFTIRVPGEPGGETEPKHQDPRYPHPPSKRKEVSRGSWDGGGGGSSPGWAIWVVLRFPSQLRVLRTG
jgi:hypothetical protein